MSKIEIEGMEFYAFHGCYAEEQKIGTKFLVNLELDGNFLRAATTDNIDDAVDYQRVYNIVSEQMQKKSHLLERVCLRILDAIILAFPEIKSVTAKVSKCNPTMGGKIDKVSLTMSKSQN